MEKIIKVFLLVFAFSVTLYAYQSHDATIMDNGSTHFDVAVAFFCMVIMLLVTWEYWDDDLLRLIAGTVALTTINNFLDESLFNPYIFDWNEKVFAIIATANFFINLYILIKNGLNAKRR